MKTIGIVGGAGPMASCLLYKTIITLCQQKFCAKNDNDFPEIIIVSFPFSPMLATSDSYKNQRLIEAELQKCIDKLKSCNVELVTIACNTLHAFAKNINFYDMQLLHIIEETIGISKQKKLLVLATPTTVKSKIYESPNVSIVYPAEEDQQEVSAIIDRILEGTVLLSDEIKIREIAAKTKNVDAVVLGCTELSVLFENDQSFIDPLKILAEKTVMRAFLSRD